MIHVEKVSFKNRWGRQNYIEIYHNSKGYPYSCRMCGNKATWQGALFDHLSQPQGSLYYCDSCVPDNHTIISE